MKSVLIVSHGSRSKETGLEVSSLASALRKRFKKSTIKYAFLELQPPSIPEGIDELIDEGAEEILILLNFLNAGRHVDADIPAIIKEKQKEHPDTKITISRPVGQHEGIVDLFVDMINNTD